MSDSITQTYHDLRDQWDALTDERREVLLAGFVPDYVYNSEKIENPELTFATAREVVERGAVTGYTGDCQLLTETYNLKVSWELARAKLAEDPCLSEELVCQAQELVTMGTYSEKLLLAGERPGLFKLGNYVGGPASVGIPAVKVPHEVGVLADDVNTYLEEGRRSLTIAAFLHAKIFDIHPFADGNGRTARLLMNGVLLAMGMPPIVIHAQNHAAYHAALDVFHLEGDLNPLKRFLMTEAVLTWEGLLGEDA
ncbi:Fic family protein [Olsenella profusa]|uniref:Fic family protein n=1 Tax=Olsenella profusa TaxID=138595 RepID=A0ABS2EZD4_9ACTN|nr:Fic family protein [Olsenella profusa]MBM6773992.1 Fic family protein [Olsenella profusa]